MVRNDISLLPKIGLIIPVVVFFYPLLMNFGAGNSPEMAWVAPKLVLLVGIGFLALVEYRKILTYQKYVLLLSVYLLFVVVGNLYAARFDDDITNEFLGSKDRMDGLIYQIALVVWGILLYAIFLVNRKILEATLYALFGTAVLQSILVTMQYLGLDPIGHLLQGQAFRTPNGTIGHPGMVAGLLLPSLIIGIAVQMKLTNYQRYLFLIPLSIVAIGLGLTITKASLFALLGVLVIWVALARSLKLFVLAVYLFTAVYASQSAFSQLSIGQQSPNFERSYSDFTTGQTRMHIWNMLIPASMSIPGFPLIGGGADGVKLTFLRYVKPEDLVPLYQLEYGWDKDNTVVKIETLHEADNPIRSKAYLFTFEKPFKDSKTSQALYMVNFDKAHNMILDKAISYGIPAAVIWIVLYLAPIFLCIFSKDKLLNGVGWALLGVFVYYLVWFPVVQTEPMHMVLIAIAWASLTQIRAQSVTPSAP
jgi:O-antigen ligase